MEGLKPANQNPWYVLMTLYGEPTKVDDYTLHDRNREVWNQWSCAGLDEETQNWATQAGWHLPDHERWKALRPVIEKAHLAAMQARNSDGFTYPGFPDPFAQIDLFGHHFSAPLMANGMIFAADAIFAQSQFDQRADFGRAHFLKSAQFPQARFNAYTIFTAAQFHADTNFSSAQFSELVQFIGTIFIADPRPGLNHSGMTVFNSTLFNGEADFTQATFQRSTFFDRATFSGFAKFAGAQFGGSSNSNRLVFKEATFHKPTDFKDAKFKSEYPDLTGTALHSQTSFTAAPANWPQTYDPQKTHARETCAIIRHNLGKQGLPEAEHFFYRKEMSFAAREGSFLQRLPYWAFGAFSDFGYSIERPVKALAWVWVLGSLIFAAAWFTGHPLHDLKELGRGAALSFANLFTVFGLHKVWFNSGWLETLAWPLKLIGGLQTVLSLPLLFFLVLALRTKFRLR